MIVLNCNEARRKQVEPSLFTARTRKVKPGCTPQPVEIRVEVALASSCLPALTVHVICTTPQIFLLTFREKTFESLLYSPLQIHKV